MHVAIGDRALNFRTRQAELDDIQAVDLEPFDHGGISPEEMIVPVARLTPRPG